MTLEGQIRDLPEGGVLEEVGVQPVSLMIRIAE